MPKISIPPLEIESSQGFSDPADECGPYATAALGDLGGLSQFGVRIEMLPPVRPPRYATGTPPKTNSSTCWTGNSCLSKTLAKAS